MHQRIQIEKMSGYIRRIGHPSDIDAEDQWENLPESLHQFAPNRLSYSIAENVATREEENLGPIHSDPQLSIQHWWNERLPFWNVQPKQEQTLRQWLKQTTPHGKIQIGE